MSDDIVSKLREDWNRQPLAIDKLAKGLQRRRRLARLSLAKDAIAMAVAVVAGIWFAIIAIDRESLVFGLSGLFILVAVPLTKMARIRAQAAAPDWRGDTAEDILRKALNRERTTVKLLRIRSWESVALIGFAALLWGCAAAKLLSVNGSFVVILTIWVITGVGGMAWSAWRLRLALRRVANCEALLEQYVEIDDLVG